MVRGESSFNGCYIQTLDSFHRRTCVRAWRLHVSGRPEQQDESVLKTNDTQCLFVLPSVSDQDSVGPSRPVNTALDTRDNGHFLSLTGPERKTPVVRGIPTSCVLQPLPLTSDPGGDVKTSSIRT